MSWSYSGDPSASTLDEVRFLIGDTDIDDQQLSDEEITYLLAEYESALPAAIAAAEGIAAKYARLVDQKTGDIDVKFSQRAAHYSQLAADLRRKIGILAEPYVGGISVSDTEIDKDDDDVVQPAFEVGMMDNNKC